MDLSSATPTAIGKYEIRGVLGRGAMGTVYDGWDPVIGRRVAIKTVRLLGHADPEVAEGLERFKREAQAAGRLSHPNIVSVYDYGETEETAYIVMEFVEGQSLKQRLDAGERFPVEETVRIMEQILAGLQSSHASGVIHRDIKPGNVMLARDGRVKLADFGIARIESSVMTQDGAMLGTPAYMSPEQLMVLSIDQRSDVYSAGVVLYQLLTGERPFEGGLAAITHKALNTVPPRPSVIAVTVPPGLDAVVACAMSRRPADRYPDADSFARALRAAFEAPVLPDAAMDDDDTVVVRPARATPAVETVAPPETMKPTPAKPAPAAKGAGGPSKALLGGVAAAVLLAVGGGAWLALRPSAPAQIAVVAPRDPPRDPPVPVKPVADLPPAAPAPVLQKASASTPDLPPSPPAPPVAAPPVAAPLVPAPGLAVIAPPNRIAIHDALESLSVSANCAIPRFSVTDDGGITVSGIVGTGPPATALYEAVRKAVGGAQLSWLMRPVDGPYCDALDIVRPIDQPSSPPFGLMLKDDATRLKDGDAIRPILKLPAFPAHLVVDYLSHDGSVTHLFPGPGGKDRIFEANESLPLGNPTLGVGAVGTPFGTDVIVAIASSVPLFAQRRPADAENTATYLPALQAALDAASHDNAKLTGRALVLETVAR
jgi:serine/threonine-protein kinase